jgi:hypothetical protein
LFGEPYNVPKGKHNVYVNFGSGEKGVMISEGDNLAFIRPWERSSAPTVFAVCNEAIDLVSHDETEKHLTIDWFTSTAENDGEFELVVPEGCVPATLVPQCATLPDVPEGGPASHEWAQEIRCYENVMAVDWRQ